MARAIDADAFEKFLMNLPDEVLCEDCCYVVVNEMRKQPTIEAEPVMHGEWVDRMCRDWRCSECGGEICKFRHVDGYTRDDKPKYCPDCGARMDGE